jgi:hypothetical protein
MVATINDLLDYFGSTVSTTGQLLDALPARQTAARPRIVVSEAIACDPQVVAAVSAAANHLQLKPGAESAGQSRGGMIPHEVVEAVRPFAE